MIKAIYYPTNKRGYSEVWYDFEGYEHECRTPVENTIELTERILTEQFNSALRRIGFDPGYPEGDFAFITIKPAPRSEFDIETPFVWRTHKGDEYLPEDMSAPHLFYSIRMMFNNTVPANYRVGEPCDNNGNGGWRKYPDIATWSPIYLFTAMYSLCEELRDRVDELEDWQQDEFSDLLRNSARLAKKEFWCRKLETALA